MFDATSFLSDYKNGIIKVFGVGGAGNNAINYMIEQGFSNAEIYAINTDVQALKKSLAPSKIQIGEELTRGLGAGANPNIGLLSAKENKSKIQEAIKDCDLLFIASGMGGGTGTGASAVIAEIAREMGVTTIGVVSMPFSFEGKKRANIAKQGLNKLKDEVNSLIIVPNDKLKKTLGKNMSLIQAFKAANNILYNAIDSITGIIANPGHINVDFADVKTVMSEKGVAVIGSGISSGDLRAQEASQEALSCHLLSDINLVNAKGLLVCVTSGDNISLGEFSTIGDEIYEIASDEAPVIIGTSIDESLGDSIQVTVIATGFEMSEVYSQKGDSNSRLKSVVHSNDKDLFNF